MVTKTVGIKAPSCPSQGALLVAPGSQKAQNVRQSTWHSGTTGHAGSLQPLHSPNAQGALEPMHILLLTREEVAATLVTPLSFRHLLGEAVPAA